MLCAFDFGRTWLGMLDCSRAACVVWKVRWVGQVFSIGKILEGVGVHVTKRHLETYVIMLDL